MNLNDFYPRGTKLADVPPDFRGMLGKEWRAKTMAAQADRHREKLARDGFEPPISKQKILTGRDLYGHWF